MAGLLLLIGVGFVDLLHVGEIAIVSASVSSCRRPCLGFALICLGAVTFTMARNWSALSSGEIQRLSCLPTRKNIESVPFLDITLNYMSHLMISKNYSEAIEHFGKISETTIQPELSSRIRRGWLQTRTNRREARKDSLRSSNKEPSGLRRA